MKARTHARDKNKRWIVRWINNNSSNIKVMVCIYTDHPSIHPLQAAVMIMIMIMIIIIVIMTIRAMACHIISYQTQKKKKPL